MFGHTLTKLRLSLLLLLVLIISKPSLSDDSISSADLPLEARSSDTSSQEDDLISTSYVLPNQIFNDGKPYYASKDPISGQPDFNSKKTAGIETAANEVIDPKEKIILSNSSPNIHDYLNLPVKYSSSKFVYPLVSSSYANLKYQGSNKNYITNKKPTTVAAPPSPSPSYHSLLDNNNSTKHYTVPTTKLVAVKPTATSVSHTTGGIKITFTKPNTTAATITSTNGSSSSHAKTDKMPTPTTYTSTTTTTTLPPMTSPKYKETTTRFTVSGTAATASRFSTTRKKFVPTKKYTSMTSVLVNSQTTSMRTHPQTTQATLFTRPTTTTTTETATPESELPQISNSNWTSIKNLHSTRHPIVFTEGPSIRPTYSHLLNNTEQRIPDLEPADVYQTLGQKNTEFKTEQKPSISLTDIFNNLADEESAVSSQSQGSQGFNGQGNLMQPITPSKPSPFVIQQIGSQPIPRPDSTTITVSQAPVREKQQPSLQQQQQAPLQQQQLQQQQQQQYPPITSQDQKVISGSQENYNNEYVSYQVQQPNVLQYRPVPGAINNVVISPGQNSASFILGSQQQVGNKVFGSVEKEPLFSKEPPVQYGTVINEDISGLKRMPDTSAPQMPNTFSQIPNSPQSPNYYQAGGFVHHATATPEINHFTQRPVAPSNYHGTPPPPPLPYQQLPLIGSQKHSTMQQLQQQSQSLPTFQSLQSKPQQQVPQQLQINSNHQQLLRPQSSAPQQHQPSSINISGEQATQEMLVSTNIRFPDHDDPPEEISPNVLQNPPVGPQINGHAQPLSLQQIQQSKPVVFPKTNEHDIHKPPHLVVNHPNPPINGFPDQSDVQIQKHEVLTMHQHKQKLNFVAQSQASSPQHIPSQHMEPPSRFPQSAPQNLPINEAPEQPQRPSSSNTASGSQSPRKTIPGITRPNQYHHHHHLPNILPQFRPNAKISTGHSPAYNLESGNLQIAPNQSAKRPHSLPQFAHRHQSVPQNQQYPQRYPMKRFSEYPATKTNRRVFQLPPYGEQQQPQQTEFVDRLYHSRRPLPNGNALERHAMSSLKNERYQTLPQIPPVLSSEKLAAFEEEDLVINDPPQPLASSNDPKVMEEENLEPVVTLQMLQSHKKSPAMVSLTSIDDSDSGQMKVNADSGSAPFQNVVSQNGLYVVYPVKEETANIGMRNEPTDPKKKQAPGFSPADGPPTGSAEYQNTPFSVMRDQPQEPILIVKNKKPQSLQQQTKQAHQQVRKEKFPYAIEKPDPIYTEGNSQKRMPGVLIAPRIINEAHVTGTSAPIAIAYTPTEPHPHNHQPSYLQNTPIPQNNKYSNVNLASSVITEIRPLGAQTEEGYNNDIDLRGQNYEKDFMAPFYPSVSLGSATKTPSNGWNILPSTTENALFLKNYINRADNADMKYETETMEATTNSFEFDHFQPELQGGFKPIYPPGYKANSEPEEIRLHEGEDSPVAMASHMESPISLQTTSAPQISTTLKIPKEVSISSTTATPPNTPVARISTTSTTKSYVEPLKNSTAATSINPTSRPKATTTTPASTSSATSTIQPNLDNKTKFETSLAALLFGEDEDFEDGEARKQNVVRAVSGPRSYVPRGGPRNLKLS